MKKESLMLILLTTVVVIIAWLLNSRVIFTCTIISFLMGVLPAVNKK